MTARPSAAHHPLIVKQDLTALLLEFEACYRSGREMDSQWLDELRGAVKDALIGEYAAHDGHIPVRDKKTKMISWKSRRQLRGWRTLELWENVSDTASDWLDHLVTTLDRMLTRGTRRDGLTRKFPPPRLAEQVAARLAAGLKIDEPMQLVIDCLKYAMYDEMLAATKRIKNGNARRVRLAPRARKHDKNTLIRKFGSQRLLTAPGVNHDDLAYCIGFEYQRGGLDRAAVEPLAALPFGNGGCGVSALRQGTCASAARLDTQAPRARKGHRRQRIRRNPVKRRHAVGANQPEVSLHAQSQTDRGSGRMNSRGRSIARPISVPLPWNGGGNPS